MFIPKVTIVHFVTTVHNYDNAAIFLIVSLLLYTYNPQVVLGSAGFSDGGAQQLQYDVTKVLVPLLAKYCHTVPRKQLLER